MPFNKVQFNPGINREVTKYTNEAGWYDCNRIRFREGYPEQIGGWQALGKNTFTGVCRSLHQWVTLGFVKYTGLGTNVKFMVETGTNYYDITPLRTTATLGTNPIKTTDDSTTIEITHANHGATLGSYVTISGVPNGDVGGIPHTDINKEHVITEIVSTSKYTVVVDTTATSTVPAGGGGSVVAAYQINVGPDFQIPTRGWNSLPWNGGVYNGDSDGSEAIRIWNQANYGEDLIIGPRGGELYYWDSSAGTGTRAISLKNVTHGSTVALTQTSTGNTNTSYAYITSVDAAVGAKIRVGATVSGTGIAVGTTVLSVSADNTVVNISANPTATASGNTFNFDTDPISVTKDSKTITVFDPTLEFAYKVGQHVTIAGATTVAAITGTVINARHKIVTVDSASNTFTVDIAGAEPASSTTSGGGASVTVQYELSAEVPVVQDNLLVSDASRFVFAFGCNAFGDATEIQNPLLLRWSDQENAYDWRPRSTNQAGDLQLSQGTEIVAAIQSRQEILVFTDAALYSLQYVGAPVVWGSQLVGSNLSVASSKAVAYANGVAYWMGKGKFYKYDGVVQPLDCTVQEYVFSKLDIGQYEQVFAGSLEEFHEIWWFYVSTNNTTKIAPDKYVVYNYLDGVWYFGELDRSAWFDSPINDYPLAATSQYTLVEHENGNNDGQNYASVRPINSYITSGQFGIESGDSFTFIDKIIPDLSFIGSTTRGTVTMSLLPSSAPGLDNNNPLSEGGTNAGEVDQTYDLDEHTPLLYVRIRGRQLALKLSCSSPGTKWKLGTPRLNMRPDGRRGKN